MTPPLSTHLGPLLLQFAETLESFTRATLWEFQSITAWLDAMEADGYPSPAEEEARLPPRPPVVEAGGDEGASPEHRRLIRRTKRLPRRQLRVLGVLATMLGEKGGTPSDEETTREEVEM